jgi:hypothetical protein
MRFSAPADVGALVEAALKEAKDALFSAGRTEVTWGDAMAEVARRSLGAVDSMSRRDSFRTYVHLDSDGGWLTGQPRMPAHITKKLTCDGILQPVWHSQGASVNVRRAQRIVPARTRRLVEDRDRGCRFPGCSTTRHVECHHLIHWVNGGTTDTWNLCCLCDLHHDAHHDGDFTITGDPNNLTGLTFTTRNGFPIRPGPTFATPANPPPPPSPPESAESLPSSGPRRAPESAQSPGSTGAPGPADSGSPNSPPEPTPRGKTAYHGPSGETLNLRWVTFHEPRKPALV